MASHFLELLSDPEVQAMLAFLNGGREFAGRLHPPRESFPFPIALILRAGITADRLGALQDAGLIDQSEEGCWLTDAGARALRAPGAEQPQPDGQATPGEPLAGDPSWHACEGELRVGEIVVKRVPKNATRMIPLLNAFQKDSWPAELPNPFGKDHPLFVAQLHEAVRGLNTGQRPKALHFQVVREGTSVTWRRTTMTNRSSERS